jgi:beta-phosphoglucomutase
VNARTKSELARSGDSHYTASMKAVLFDLDGVVVYTDAYHYQGWKRLADDEGWSFDESLSDQLRGVSRMPALQIILDYNGVDFPEDQKKQMADRKNEYYRELLKQVDESALVAGALDFIRAIRARGIRTGLGSGSKNALTVLNTLKIAPLFEAIVTGEDITRSKPDPQIFLLGAERLGLDPADCVVFEDAVSGVEAANAAGMLSVGFGPTEGLDQAQADLLVPDYASLDVDAFVRGDLFH